MFKCNAGLPTLLDHSWCNSGISPSSRHRPTRLAEGTLDNMQSSAAPQPLIVVPLPCGASRCARVTEDVLIPSFGAAEPNGSPISLAALLLRRMYAAGSSPTTAGNLSMAATILLCKELSSFAIVSCGGHLLTR